ncbi:hypothetical protein [uncultured Rikenella sp.]|uniref:hypothetical protein n=1 Tax=uncultured Rikenella sp. TaxID=368003 RepID=UPI00261D2F0D|nr:hypothetical protein [uncultured Rikenella sp.]
MHTIVATVFRCVASRNKRKTHPAPGFRYYTSGEPGGVGTYGYSWSSSSDNSGDHYRGMYLIFSVATLNPSNASFRGHGLQLRCLSE